MESILHLNTMSISVLSTIIFLPIGGALLLPLISDDRAAKLYSLLLTVVVMILSVPLYTRFDPGLSGFQFVEQRTWVESVGLSYLLGIDGISLPMILLTTLFGPIVVLCSWSYITKRVRAFMACLLLTQGIMVGVFAALDVMLFYFFFESLLVPMFLMIAVWGGPRRIYAAVKFVLYTLAGSIFLLLALIALSLKAHTFSYPVIMMLNLTPQFQFWLFLALLAAFAVKVPMFPVHTWLPAAHVEAPTAGSVILASILLKMGTYGLLRFNLALAPLASVDLAPIMVFFSIVAILYGGFLSLAQTDIKKLIAYSSVAHMGFATLGIFTLTLQGNQGAMLQMVNHGLTTGGLFLLAGMLYERSHSRELDVNAGLGRLMPAFGFFLGLFSLSSLAFPGTASFVGEFLILVGAFNLDWRVGAWAIPGALLAAAYMFRLFLRLTWDAKGNKSLARDLNFREWLSLAPLAILVMVFGFYPKPLLQIMDPALDRLIARLPIVEGSQIAAHMQTMVHSIFN
ncbi:MAG TPA: NADH-quinone oxidoreductase subunit M [Desulfocapsa sulfexigens]|nr:NADH-quinone oxidoreductase subunit M [Desulfocapsa sulfexigens]